jgi:Domain of unknown function (DUF4326)
MPKRIQRRRSRGWRMPEGTIYVGRGSRFGNPWVAWQDEADWVVSRSGEHHPGHASKREALAKAVQLFREDVERSGPQHHRRVDPVPTMTDIIKALRGKDLACWCGSDDPCHADVLLAIANGPLTERQDGR